MKAIVKKNPLFFAFFLPALTDGAVTLLGQGQQYWGPNRILNEASPAYYFLLASPWLFLFGSIIWFVFWYWLIKRLKEPYNLFLMFLFVAGHSWGSSSWIMKMFKEAGLYSIGNQLSIMFSWFLLVLYLVLIAAFSTLGLKVYLSQRIIKN